MTEQDLRAMIRESIARRVGSGATSASEPLLMQADATYRAHSSFVRLPLLSGGDDDGACLIEPAVRCNHCGYCQSYGH
jgi:hypothetical protein